MKLYTLLENTTCKPDLCTEHGLSLYLEACGHKILFDAGQTDAFFYNAKLLDVDLNAVDIAILSHGHYDHGGGMFDFLKLNERAPLYIHKNAFGERYNGRGTFIGLDEALRHNSRIRYTSGITVLADGLTLLDCNERLPVIPLNPYGLSLVQDGKLVADDFLHEQYLLVEENGKRVLITGCSHKGIINLVSWFEPDILIGGFHFKSETNPAVLRSYGEQLLQHKTIYYTGHCTGEEQYNLLKGMMGEQLHYIRTGTVLEF